MRCYGLLGRIPCISILWVSVYLVVLRLCVRFWGRVGADVVQGLTVQL